MNQMHIVFEIPYDKIPSTYFIAGFVVGIVTGILTLVIWMNR